jgi:hypothetical protein
MVLLLNNFTDQDIYRNGTYTVSNSSQLRNHSGFGVYKVSDGSETKWYSNSSYDSGNYRGNTSTIIKNGNPILGEYLQIQIPFSFNLTSYVFKGEGGATTSSNPTLPVKFYMVGSLNGSDWVILNEYNNETGFTNPFTIANPQPCKYFRFIVNRNVGYSYTSIYLFELTGH